MRTLGEYARKRSRHGVYWSIDSQGPTTDSVDRNLQPLRTMTNMKITFRGIDPEELLEASVRRWVQSIREGLPSSSRVQADVLIRRGGLERDTSTTVRVALCVDGRESVESACLHEPQSAVQECFRALDLRLRRRVVDVDAINATAARARSDLWGPQGTF